MQLSYLNTSAVVIFFPSLQVRKNLQVQSFIKAVSFFIPYSILAGLGGLTGTKVRGRGREEGGRREELRGRRRRVRVEEGGWVRQRGGKRRGGKKRSRREEVESERVGRGRERVVTSETGSNTTVLLGLKLLSAVKRYLQ